MDIKPWKILGTRYLHPDIRLDHCEMSNGHLLDAYLLDYNDECIVFPLTRKQEVVLIRQYRHGVRKAILELPGGSVDKGESPLEAARRELMEETGFSSNIFIEIGHGSPIPAILTNTLYYFLALDAERIAEQSSWDTGAIEISLIPLDQVIDMAKRGDLISSLNISSLFFVLNHLNRIS